MHHIAISTIWVRQTVIRPLETSLKSLNVAKIPIKVLKLGEPDKFYSHFVEPLFVALIRVANLTHKLDTSSNEPLRPLLNKCGSKKNTQRTRK